MLKTSYKKTITGKEINIEKEKPGHKHLDM